MNEAVITVIMTNLVIIVGMICNTILQIRQMQQMNEIKAKVTSVGNKVQDVQNDVQSGRSGINM